MNRRRDAKFNDAALARFYDQAQPRRYTAQEIANVCGVTRQRVNQIETVALQKLRVALGGDAQGFL